MGGEVCLKIEFNTLPDCTIRGRITLHGNWSSAGAIFLSSEKYSEPSETSKIISQKARS